MISLCAQAQAAGDERLEAAAWEAGASAIGWGPAGARGREAAPREGGAAAAGEPPRAALQARARRRGLTQRARRRRASADRRPIEFGSAPERPPGVAPSPCRNASPPSPSTPSSARSRAHSRARPSRAGASWPAPRTRAGAIATAAFVLPGARLRARPDLRGEGPALAGGRQRRRLQRATPTSRARSRSSRRSATSASRRSSCASTTRPSTPRSATSTTPYIAISTALHAPRLPGQLRAGGAALHLPVPRRRLRLRRQGRRAARRCARWTASTRAWRPAASTSGRASRSTASCERFSPRDPGEPLDGIGQYLYPSRPTMRKIQGT